MNRFKFKDGCSKALLVLLILSFILSSLSGIYFMLNKHTVISIGREKINIREFARLLVRERENAYMGGIYDLDYILSRKFTLEALTRIIHSRLFNKYLLDNHYLYNRDQLLDKIVKNQLFFEDGKFSVELYKKFLKSRKLSEEFYLKYLQSTASVAFFIDMITPHNLISDYFLDKIYQSTNVYKRVRLYQINKNNIPLPNIEIASGDKKDYYNEHLDRFTEPEEREIEFIRIDITNTDNPETQNNNKINKLNLLIKSKSKLTAIADSFNTKIVNVGYIKNDDKIEELFNTNEVLFKLKIGEPFVYVANGSYYVYNVKNIKKRVVQSFDSVVNIITKELLEIETNKFYNKFMTDVLKYKVFDRSKMTIKDNLVIKDLNQYSEYFIKELYRVDVGTYTGFFEKDNSFYFAQLLGETQISEDKENILDKNNIKLLFENSLNSDISMAYIKYLSEKYKVKTNYNLLKYFY